VFNFHFLYPYTRTITHGYGAAPDDKSLKYPHQLPFLCLLVRGRAMVTLFFVMSGYVLSYAFLSASTAQTEAQLAKGFTRLTSLTLRRWMRLYLPATFSMLLVMLGAFFGAFDAGREFQETSLLLTGWSEQHPPRFSSFSKQLKDFVGMWWAWSTPFQWRLFYSEYDPHTWTIPVEFRGSMALFVLLLACARLEQRWRLAALAMVTTFCFASERWDVAAFTGGALVAGIHLWQASRATKEDDSLSLPRSTAPRRARRKFAQGARRALTTLNTVVFIAALYGLSFPDDMPERTPGFGWLYGLTPPMYKAGNTRAYLFWHTLSALVGIWSVRQLYYIDAMFCLSVPQYLGQISYALYLVHGPLLHSAGFAMQPRIFQAVGGGLGGWIAGLVLGWLTMLGLSIVVAHVFWRLVDMPLVRAAKWLEQKTKATRRCQTG
jgi:peptidoglycan/LPS O-acetylase OafA/YrhL